MALKTEPCHTAIKRDVIDAIGDTPLVEISPLSPKSAVRLFAKLEGSNPSGSVKDRIAKYLVEDAEHRGLLTPGGTIVEPTSGNTGISLAMISRVRGYRLKAVMPANASPERIGLLEAYGAEIVLSDAADGVNGSIVVARRILQENAGCFMPDQHGNPANPRAHYETTGPEIARALPDVDAFVAGLGTGGTLMGVGRALREHNPDVKILAAAPRPGKRIEGLRAIEDGYVPPVLDLDRLDDRIIIDADEAVHWTKLLMSEAGIFAGVSSGAVVAAAREAARQLGKGNVVCLLADGGWKYLSSGLWTGESDGPSPQPGAGSPLSP